MSQVDSTQGVSQNSTSSTQTSASQALANKTMFLQLLVAQLKNQDPLNPADGTQFVTQLAQFSSLEQLVSISGNVETLVTNTTPTQTTTDTTTNTDPTGQTNS
jgi:flagellar basal-body rod modification protein FlgD